MNDEYKSTILYQVASNLPEGYNVFSSQINFLIDLEKASDFRQKEDKEKEELIANWMTDEKIPDGIKKLFKLANLCTKK